MEREIVSAVIGAILGMVFGAALGAMSSPGARENGPACWRWSWAS